MNSQKPKSNKMISEHQEVFDKLFFCIDTKGKYKILDAGSGETSLTLINQTFPKSSIDAIIFPGDLRKHKSVARANVKDNFKLIEADIAKTEFVNKYDIVFAHLLLGESVMWGHSVSELLMKLFSATKKYLVIIDFPQDPEIDFEEILKFAGNNGFVLVKDVIINRQEPFDGKTFVGNYYRGLLLEIK